MVLTGEICFGLEVFLREENEAGRAPSREPSGSEGPQWDNPNGQLPGTGIRGDTGDSLYRSSSLRRRRDTSPGRGTVESVGQEGVGVVPERPSLFSTSGSSSFNPFSAALSSLRPEERPVAILAQVATFAQALEASVGVLTWAELPQFAFQLGN